MVGAREVHRNVLLTPTRPLPSSATRNMFSATPHTVTPPLQTPPTKFPVDVGATGNCIVLPNLMRGTQVVEVPEPDHVKGSPARLLDWA